MRWRQHSRRGYRRLELSRPDQPNHQVDRGSTGQSKPNREFVVFFETTVKFSESRLLVRDPLEGGPARTWLYHCHVETHMQNGMTGLYAVTK
jgi:FtsP/CotA-like multicopper oxidase with cupredoxin domain